MLTTPVAYIDGVDLESNATASAASKHWHRKYYNNYFKGFLHLTR